MGWKGTMRSVVATARRMEKDAERQHKQAVKEQIADNASSAVASWENYIDNLLTIHTDIASRVDWQRLCNAPKPPTPMTTTVHTDFAQNNLKRFKPKLFDFLRGGSAKLRGNLENEVAEASKKDDRENERAIQKYANKVAEWEDDRNLAVKLLEGDSKAYLQVLEELQTLTENDLIGSAVNFAFDEGNAHVRPQVHTDEVVPNFRRKQLASGKLSESKMPAAQFNELYQDYVASVALKVAGDIFQMLPLDEVFVTCETEMLNSKTGHKEMTPILSVKFVRSTFEQLNLANIDPSDSMKNFNHEMKFTRTRGFQPVKPLIELL